MATTAELASIMNSPVKLRSVSASDLDSDGVEARAACAGELDVGGGDGGSAAGRGLPSGASSRRRRSVTLNVSSESDMTVSLAHAKSSAVY
jgi:hypothetical protein